MPPAKTKIVIVLGPTAVGKSDLALELARRLGGEIVNADALQVYRYMDIGTGKPSADQRQSVRHHLLDVVNPDEEFNAALFRSLATGAIRSIEQAGKAAVICGGTGLYLKALTQGLFAGPGRDEQLRRSLEEEIQERGLAPLYGRLAALDLRVGATIHPHDRQRIIRALEVYEHTGKPLGDWQKEHGFRDQPFEVCKIGLLRDRAELYNRINRRAERMIADGLLEEVRALVERGFGLDLKPLRSVGYRQMGAVIRGAMELSAALAEMRQETRRLAKRQLTWFRQDSEIGWFHPESQKEEIFQAVDKFLE